MQSKSKNKTKNAKEQSNYIKIGVFLVKLNCPMFIQNILKTRMIVLR